MLEKVKSYFERLEGLSTEELDHSTEELVRAEKRNVALVIAHIAEMSRRRGYLERGYKNLWDYCTRRLRLSEGSVALRIQVANVSRRFPQILLALAENRMSLTVAGLLSPVLTDSNVEKLLEDCAGMTKREAEEHLVALRPKPRFYSLHSKNAITARFDRGPDVAHIVATTHTVRGHEAAPCSAGVAEAPRAGEARDLQLSLLRRPELQGEVRAPGRGPRRGESSPKYG